MRLATLHEDTIADIRKAVDGIPGAQAAAAQIWWNPTTSKAALSTGDWANSKPWADAIIGVVGRGNLEADTEWSPNEDKGWVKVRDTRRIADHDMSQERRDEVWPNQLDEGILHCTTRLFAGKVGRALCLMENVEYIDIVSEYWIDEGGQAHIAEGDTGHDHASYVMATIRRQIAEAYDKRFDTKFEQEDVDWISFIDDAWKRLGSEISAEDPAFMWKLESFLRNAIDLGEEEWALAIGMGDHRLYALKEWNWKALRGPHIETYTFTPADRHIIINGIDDALEQEGRYELMDENADYAVDIYVAKSGDNISTTLQELYRGNQAPANKRELYGDYLRQNANKQARQQDLDMVHPYYRNKTFPTSEGVVAAARADVVNIVNDLASRIAGVAREVFTDNWIGRRLGIGRPDVSFSESGEDPAMVTITIGKRVPQAIAVTIYGDGGGEIKMEMTNQLARLLQLPQAATLSSIHEVNQRLARIVATIKRRLQRTMA